jgi:hypothetical protein
MSPVFNINEDFRLKWYPKQHITAVDLKVPGQNGQYTYGETAAMIEKIGTESLMKQKSKKREATPVAYLKGKSKYLILSNAICNGLMEATGSAIPRDWLGQEILLYVEQGVKAFGKTSDQVRVKGKGKPGTAVQFSQNVPLPEDDDPVFDEHDYADDIGGVEDDTSGPAEGK